MKTFKELGLSEPFLKTLEGLSFENPTEIQEKTIPLALAGKDVIGGAATGSGKTLAFGASMIENSTKGKGIQGLILTPTRELAEQVGQNMVIFSEFKNLNIAIVYGGVGINPQMNELEVADIVVGTPGRILDHLERRTIDLSKVKLLVLDEADRMLDMGFIDDVLKIIDNCPKERQTMLFSATISQDIDYIANKYMKNPSEVLIENRVDPSKLEQTYYDVPPNMKFSLLVHLLKNENAELVMVFCNTRDNADFVANNLKRQDIDAVAIHGGLTQAKRSKILEHFHKGKVGVLVCTDVAARGLDIQGVSHVYNYDIPKTSTDYVHRIGRTARAGKDGKAVSIVSQRDYENFSRVLEDNSLDVKPTPLPQIQQVAFRVFNNRDGDRGGDRRFGRREGGRGFGGDRRGGRSSGRQSRPRRY